MVGSKRQHPTPMRAAETGVKSQFSPVMSCRRWQSACQSQERNEPQAPPLARTGPATKQKATSRPVIAQVSLISACQHDAIETQPPAALHLGRFAQQAET